MQGSGDSTEHIHIKRLRAEDIIGDERKVTTRLLLNRAEFSLVIGKNGNTIAHIRNTFGANIKGSDIDPEYRIVIISGNLKQVIDSFDLITDLIHKAHQQSSPHDIFAINILLEHSKAGRVVGQKGSTIQGIKNRSGAHMMRLQKDPQDFYGVLLRTLSVEGHLHTVKRYIITIIITINNLLLIYLHRAHVYLQEVFHETHLQSNQNTFFEGSGNIPLPIHSLTSVGVQAETVKQLGDMKKYLAINFGLEMSISAIPGMHASNVLMQSGYGGAGQSYVNDHRPNPDDVQFAISKNSAGGIIGIDRCYYYYYYHYYHH